MVTSNRFGFLQQALINYYKDLFEEIDMCKEYCLGTYYIHSQLQANTLSLQQVIKNQPFVLLTAISNTRINFRLQDKSAR